MFKEVRKELVPTLFAVTLYSLYVVVDGMFVGNATGDIGLAAINIVWPIAAIIMACGIGIGTGGSVWISYYRGQKNEEEGKNIYATINVLLVLVGLAFLSLLLVYEQLVFLLGARNDVYIEACKYIRVLIQFSVFLVVGTGLLPVLRNLGMAKQALCCTITGLCFNVMINYYLLFEKNMGIQGAAYGTILSQSIASLIGVAFLLKKGDYGISFKGNKAYIKRILKSGVTPFGIYLAPSITLVFTNWQCLRYGGDPVVACYAVISYIVFPVLAVLGGVGDGIQPLISYYYGADDKEGLEKLKKIASRFLLVISISCILITIVGTSVLAKGFGLSVDATTYFMIGMPISALAFLLQGFTKFNCAYLNATMQSGYAMILTYAESLVVNPIMLVIWPLVFATNGIWLAPFATGCVMLVSYHVGLKYRTKIR